MTADDLTARHLRVGLSTGALYPGTPTERVAEIAAGWGVADLELMLQTPGEHAPAFVRDAVDRARSQGIDVRALHSYQQFFPMVTPYARRTDEAFALFATLIEATGGAGVPVIVWHGPSRDEVSAPDQWGPFLTVTSRLAELAHAAGVTIALENVSWCVLATVRDCFALANRLPELGPPGSLGFTFDPFQALKARANPFMILNAMAGHLVEAHLADISEEALDAAPHPPRALPGRGDIPWSALLRAIKGAGYRGPMMLETPFGSDGDGWRETCAFIDPLIEALAHPTAEAPLPPGVIEGIELFNAGGWYEAHEALEHEWHAERGEDRRLYQGILQIGVGLHHARSGNHRGAVLLLTDGIEKTARFTPAHRGLDIARLVREAQACLDQVITLGPDHLTAFDWSLVPVIELPASRYSDFR